MSLRLPLVALCIVGCVSRTPQASSATATTSATSATSATAAPTPPAAQKTCFDDWARSTFSFPPDPVACSGTKWTRFDARYGLTVGAVECGDGALRLYLAEHPHG